MNVKELLLINFNELFIFIAFKVWTVKWEIWITGNKWKNIPQKQRKTRERQWGGEGALRRHTKKQNHGYRTRDLQQLSYIWQIYRMLLQFLLSSNNMLSCLSILLLTLLSHSWWLTGCTPSWRGKQGLYWQVPWNSGKENKFLTKGRKERTHECISLETMYL